ncbi:MAG: DUF4149 domain-containing protein [Gammaproteobacteria bacterium]|nr:MAG: DUF4149 domain-containing protein [Gammaproteobacteria bacterium]
MFRIYPAIERTLLTLWIGGLWVVGFVVAPALFAKLPDTATAGSVAGSLFTIMSRIGLGCAAGLLVIGWLQGSCQARRWQLLVIAVMVALVVLGESVLAPMISELRATGQVASPRFGQLHGLASGVYLVNCVLGLVLLVTWPEVERTGSRSL